MKNHNINLDKFYKGRTQELFVKEKNFTDNKGWTPLMYLCDINGLNSTHYYEIFQFLRYFPELLENQVDPQKWTKYMKMALLIGGAKYADLNHPEFQKVWWNAKEEIDKNYSVLLIRIARHSPGAFNRNSRFMRRLLYSAGFKDVHNKSAFHYVT